MSIEQILKELRQERTQLDTAIQALEGVARITSSTPSRGKSSRKGSMMSGPRKMSAAARRKISLAQKARWAKVRAGKK